MRENAKTMTLRLNAAEYAHLCQQAEAAGLKKEPFVRTLIMGVNLRPRPPDEYAEIRRQHQSDRPRGQCPRFCYEGGNCCDHGCAGDDLDHRGAALIWRTRKYLPSAQGWMTA